MVVDWICRLHNTTFESGVVPENWRSVVIVSFYKSKGEKTECKNYRDISLLGVVGKVLFYIYLMGFNLIPPLQGLCASMPRKETRRKGQ